MLGRPAHRGAVAPESLIRRRTAVEASTMDPEVFTIDDVARLLHANLRQVQKLVSIGLLHLDIGGPRGLVSATELERFLRANPGWLR